MADPTQPTPPPVQNPPPTPAPTAPTATPAPQQTVQNVELGVQNATQAAQNVQQGVQNAGQAVTGGMQQGLDALKKAGVTDMFKAAENQPKVNAEEKMWAMVSYIPLVAILSLLIKPDSKFVRLHGRQGLILFGIFFVCIFLYLVPFIGALFGGLIQFAIFVLGVFSMYQALIGNWWKIPVLGDVAEMIPIDLFTTVAKEVVTGEAAPQDQMPPIEQQPPAQEPPAQTPPPTQPTPPPPSA